jgi:hypothetical protein
MPKARARTKRLKEKDANEALRSPARSTAKPHCLIEMVDGPVLTIARSSTGIARVHPTNASRAFEPKTRSGRIDRAAARRLRTTLKMASSRSATPTLSNTKLLVHTFLMMGQ